MNIENTTDFSKHLQNITDEDHQESSFYMNEQDFRWAQREFTIQYNTFICERDCMFLLWRYNLDGCDLQDFFTENVATIIIADQTFTPLEMYALNKKYQR
jgi:hypothetical protein